jgi:hypothetical protein
MNLNDTYLPAFIECWLRGKLDIEQAGYYGICGMDKKLLVIWPLVVLDRNVGFVSCFSVIMTKERTGKKTNMSFCPW